MLAPGQTQSAREFLHAIKGDPRGSVCLDMRAPIEYSQGHFPGALNFPILTDKERTSVGTIYKNEGSEAALILGHQLVGPTRETRVDAWASALEKHSETQRYLYCFRGGLRSRLSQEWLAARSVSVVRVEGGYKSLRSELLHAIEDFRPPLIVLSGMTGAGKTEILKKLPWNFVVDLEGMAGHRGSSFGQRVSREQKTQQNFENELGFRLLGEFNPVLVECESRMIGRCTIPQAFYNKMSEGVEVQVREGLAERSERIYREYVISEFESGLSSSVIFETYLAAIYRIQKKLGGLMTSIVQEKLRSAFQAGPEDQEAHQSWIELLLVEYYDRLYEKSLGSRSRKVIFSGNSKEVYESLKDPAYWRRP